MMLLIQWLFVHLFTDFVLQTSSMVRHKRRLKARSWTLYVHCLLHGGLIYLMSIACCTAVLYTLSPPTGRVGKYR
jgi:Protein of unknown function (DUF3307).